jgi:CheY-like chemotaxis protein
MAHILIVDDYVPNILIATMILDQVGHSYDIAHHGPAALKFFARDKYSVILMDIQMPEMTGLEVTRRIRSHEFKNKLHPTPIIALTAAGLNIREDCIACGMNGFIAKPYLPKELHDAINQVVLP